jgi:hypothetical protein
VLFVRQLKTDVPPAGSILNAAPKSLPEDELYVSHFQVLMLKRRVFAAART